MNQIRETNPEVLERIATAYGHPTGWNKIVPSLAPEGKPESLQAFFDLKCAVGKIKLVMDIGKMKPKWKESQELLDMLFEQFNESHKLGTYTLNERHVLLHGIITAYNVSYTP